MTTRCVIGLGNPGHEYEATRHNIGFRVIDSFAAGVGAPSFLEQAECLVSPLETDPPVLLAKPQRFMNRSGAAVAALLAWLNLAPEHVLVVVDDVDLPLGRLRLRPSGGPGSHNGMRDLVAALGPAFPRLRVGVRGDDPWDDLAEYVLSPFDEHELTAVDTTLSRAVAAIELLLSQGLASAMNRFNQAPEDSEQDPPEAPSR